MGAAAEVAGEGEESFLQVYLEDLSWASEIVTNLEISSDFVVGWGGWRHLFL